MKFNVYKNGKLIVRKEDVKVGGDGLLFVDSDGLTYKEAVKFKNEILKQNPESNITFIENGRGITINNQEVATIKLCHSLQICLCCNNNFNESTGYVYKDEQNNLYYICNCCYKNNKKRVIEVVEEYELVELVKALIEEDN